jgi:hypothetical protein
MLREFIYRTIFAAGVVGLYALGSVLSPWLAQKGYAIDLAVLLPLISIVYLTYVMRLLSNRFVMIGCRDPYLQGRYIVVPIEVQYLGMHPQHFRVRNVSGPSNANVFISASNHPLDDSDDNFCIPETYAFIISATDPIRCFSLVFALKAVPDLDPNDIATHRLQVSLSADIGKLRRSKRWSLSLESRHATQN